MLQPLHEALSTLQQTITSNPNLLGAITSDLLQTLADAAVFQELCSGDMSCVPGLTSSSRLTCLLRFLHTEAESLQSDSHHSDINTRQASKQQQHSSQPAQKQQGEDSDGMNTEHDQPNVAQTAGSPNSHHAQQSHHKQSGSLSTGGPKSQDSESLDTFVSVETGVEDHDSITLPNASEGGGPARLHAVIVVAEQVTALR